jgi:hypothetical protein
MTDIENLVWKREGKIARCGWLDNIEMDVSDRGRVYGGLL